MNAFDFPLSFPEELPSYLAIFGLLISWKLHEVAVQLGRIQPKDVRDVVRRLARARPILQRQRASAWLFIYLSRNDSQSCAQCTKAHLHVFSGSNLREAAAHIRCVDTHGCRCVVIPMTGWWPMAKRLQAQLSSQHGPLQLSERDLRSLIHQGENSGEQDQLACRLLHAMLGEETDPHAARETYVHAIAATPKGSSNPLLQVAGYIRLTDLLERSGDFTEAAQVTRSFLKAFTEKDRHLVLAEPQYYGIMARKTRLLRSLLSPPGKVSSL
jgi:hypothetical protein